MRAPAVAGGYVAIVDEVIGGYRDAAPPGRERFPLRMGTGTLVGFWATVGTSALSVMLLLMTGHLFYLFCFAALGPGVFYLFSSSRRLIEVGRDEAWVHSWSGKTVCLPASELSVRYGDVELVLAAGAGRIVIAAEQFPNESLDGCVSALRECGARVVDARSERRGVTAR